MQQWFIRLRRAGKTVVLVDHASRGGSSRGTSKREDILDTVINLKRPDDYEAEEGARFEVHLQKARGVFGPDAQPFEAKLETSDGADYWVVKSMDDLNEERVAELTKAGRSVREIAAELGIGKSTVSRIQMRLRDKQGQWDKSQDYVKKQIVNTSQANGTGRDKHGTTACPNVPSSLRRGTAGQPPCEACDGFGCPTCRPKDFGICVSY